MFKKSYLVCFICLLILTGCLSMDSAMTEGTVQFMELEGNFYGIVTDAGEKLLPQNLDDQYKKDGLRIVFQYEELTDLMTIQQWGSPVEIKSVQTIE